jgi:hypothetical protein
MDEKESERVKENPDELRVRMVAGDQNEFVCGRAELRDIYIYRREGAMITTIRSNGCVKGRSVCARRLERLSGWVGVFVIFGLVVRASCGERTSS